MLQVAMQLCDYLILMFGTAGLAMGLLWCLAALANKLIDQLLVLFTVKVEFHFFLLHRQRIRIAINENSELLSWWEQTLRNRVRGRR